MTEQLHMPHDEEIAPTQENDVMSLDLSWRLQLNAEMSEDEKQDRREQIRDFYSDAAKRARNYGKQVQIQRNGVRVMGQLSRLVADIENTK